MGMTQRTVGTAVARFTTEQAVRAGVVTAAWSGAASYARGLLPRTPLQQAGATGVTMAAHYQLGATLWSALASTAAGLPGSRAGNRALLGAAAVSGIGGKVLEVQLRPVSGDNIWLGSAWSSAKMLSVVGLAGGLVTASDILVHDVLDLPRSPGTTLALDLSTGALMAGGTFARRARRARRYGGTSIESAPVDAKQRALKRAKTTTYVAGTAVGTSVGLGLLAVAEQAAAGQVARAVNAAAGEDLEEFSVWVGHTVTFGAFATCCYTALRLGRKRLEHRAAVLEPAYEEAPASEFVSAGPNSSVEFDDIGREGRRFVVMRLDPGEIESVMKEPAAEPIRVVIPRTGSVERRAALAVDELVATRGIERSLICVASPTGVGYVNYTMAEALEYLTRGDCAIVVPQYAYVPSVLALNKTSEATGLQEAVIEAIRAELQRRGSGARIVQFGESLGAQVAVDVGGVDGSAGFERAGLAAGLYLGVPFRSSLWRCYLRDPKGMTADGVIVVAASSDELGDVAGHHVLINHHDDPITKFAYTMVVQRPWWMGPPATRPPEVPRETHFRPITSCVLAMVDVFNGMNSKPGQFQRLGHDYRFDLREALQKTYGLPLTNDQVVRVEAALRQREQEWAERRLVARTGEKALANLRRTINSWGRDSVNHELDELPADVAQSRLIEYLSARLTPRNKTEQEPGDVQSDSSSSSSST